MIQLLALEAVLETLISFAIVDWGSPFEIYSVTSQEFFISNYSSTGSKELAAQAIGNSY